MQDVWKYKYFFAFFALDLSSSGSMAGLRTASAAVNYNDIMCI
jgi:hypothetical protein